MPKQPIPAPPVHPVCDTAVPPAAHVFGFASLVVTGFAVPAIWYISSQDKISPADRWVLRGAAGATALVAGPLALYYVSVLRGHR